MHLEGAGEAGAVAVEHDGGAAADVDTVFSAAAVPLNGVLRVVLDGQGRACDVDGVVAGAVDGVNVARNAAAVERQARAAEVQARTAAEGDGHPAELGIAGRADAGHHDGAAVKGERRAAERDALAGEGDAVIALDGDALRQIHAAAGAVVEKLDNVAALRGLHRIVQRLILDVADLGEVLRLRRRLNRSGGGLRRCLAALNGGSSLRLAVGKRRRHERQKHDERHHERQKLSAIEFLHFLSPPFQNRKSQVSPHCGNISNFLCIFSACIQIITR